MSTLFSFQLVTPEGVAVHDEVREVILPTRSGEIGILAGHTPIVSILKPGVMRVKKLEHEILLAVGRGFIEVRDSGEVVILSDMVDFAEDIDIEQAARARDRAQKLLEEKVNEDEVDFAQFEAQFERELARYKVADMHSRK